ncbi:type II secretion system F family protein [Nesterenkonia sp.]|uniref:type II secretion system F family protein n=1 Tax=Nesterenkonia sp. TaxID=704201 RepID=UPI00262C1FAB|nr:type II secretion system F family protein [Nesterenkonia sp.]
MAPDVILLVLAGVLAIACIGLVLFASGSADQAAVVRAESGGLRGTFRGSILRPLDQAFGRTALGGRLTTQLVEANLRSLMPLEYAVIGLTLVMGAFFIAHTQVTVLWALLMALGVAAGLGLLLTFLQQRQYRLFLQQLPELARILANSTNAGLSIRTALQIAAAEMSDPAGRELAMLNHELAIGTPIDVALERMESRIPGRDLTVLIGTLVISQRSGGSLITALRGMAQALEDRKETSREVRTLVTQSSYTGYMVVGLGVGLVLLFNLISPGLLYDLTSSLLGQITLVFTGITYAIGLILINRISKVNI